jgi:hypothetical protein
MRYKLDLTHSACEPAAVVRLPGHHNTQLQTPKLTLHFEFASESYWILDRVLGQADPRLNVMDLQTFIRPRAWQH